MTIHLSMEGALDVWVEDSRPRFVDAFARDLSTLKEACPYSSCGAPNLENMANLELVGFGIYAPHPAQQCLRSGFDGRRLSIRHFVHLMDWACDFPAFISSLLFNRIDERNQGYLDEEMFFR